MITVNANGYLVEEGTILNNPSLDSLLASLPGFALLTSSMKLGALNSALIPDSLGVWPGQPNYVTTYDVYFAAISLIGFLQAQPVIRQSSSEGTSVSVDAPNWSGLVSWYRSMSQIAQLSGQTVLGVITIPEVPHVIHTDMRGRSGDTNDNVDTDLG